MWDATRHARPALLLFAVLPALTGCLVNEPSPPVDREVSFASEVQPILTEHCASCHSEDGFAYNVGIPMRLTEGDSWGDTVGQPSVKDPELTLVTPMDPANSLLYRKVSEDAPPIGSTMPLFGERLSPEDLGLIRDWIEQGAMDN